jgi:hypothetical protein
MLKNKHLLYVIPLIMLTSSAFIKIDPTATITPPSTTKEYKGTDAFWLPFSNSKRAALKVPARLVTDVLYPGQSLYQGDYLVSANGDYTLFMQHDGNLVLYDYYGTPIWATNTCCNSAINRVTMQSDGNLVLYDVSNNYHWASWTQNYPNGYLWVTNWGVLYIIQGGVVRWSSSW